MRWLLTLLVSLCPFMASAADLVEPLRFDGENRRYELHLPPQYASKDLPVVVNLHGGGGNAQMHRVQTQMDKTADKYGFIVVYPEGTATGLAKLVRMYTWNAGACCGTSVEDNVDDVGFISKVLDDLDKKYRIDKKRIYCTGMSNGAMMAYRLGMEKADRFAAICAVASAKGTSKPLPARPVPVLHIHGLWDTNAPYTGGIGPTSVSQHEHESVYDTMFWWCDANGLLKQQYLWRVYRQYVVGKWDNARRNSGAPVELYLLRDGGHTWPGGVDVTPNAGTGPVSSFSANETMWTFFKRFKLP